MSDQKTNEKPPETEESAPDGRSSSRRRRLRAAVVVVVVLAVVVAILYWLHARNYASTDDAYVDGNSVQVSPRVAGTVVAVKVRDNQFVDKGDLLVKLDPKDYKAQVASAKASLEAALARQKAAKAGLALTQVTAGAGVEQAKSALAAARSSVQEAKANAEAAHAGYVRARADKQRYRALYKKHEASRQHYQQVVATAKSARAQWEAAKHQVATAKAQVTVAKAKLKNANSAPQQVEVKSSQLKTSSASVKQARAALKSARLKLSFTVIRAPQSGYITKKSVVAGDTVQAGQALTAIVYGTPWITANFKETDLSRVHPGQSVDVDVDAYPNTTYKAHVQSIQRGTGSHFSLLPPENATGNFVKTVQRVPVKIVFDNPPDKHMLALGMSVVPTVDLTSGEDQEATQAQ